MAFSRGIELLEEGFVRDELAVLDRVRCAAFAIGRGGPPGETQLELDCREALLLAIGEVELPVFFRAEGELVQTVLARKKKGVPSVCSR